jgi:TfoX/Sxy family transcriptional regulator of competence genes
MPWKKVSAEVSEILAEALAPFNCQRKQMFGCPCYFVNGNMFAGVHEDTLLIRLSAPDRVAIIAGNDEVSQFEPMEGRPMKEYVVLPPSIYGDGRLFHDWLDRSHKYASSLPPKKPKVGKG